jgi:hypothetical protein
VIVYAKLIQCVAMRRRRRNDGFAPASLQAETATAKGQVENMNPSGVVTVVVVHCLKSKVERQPHQMLLQQPPPQINPLPMGIFACTQQQ